jgi:hypothetical protein
MAKHPGGRPLKFASTEELQNKINAYFESCYQDVEVKKGKGKNQTTEVIHKRVKPFTVSGLAAFLDCDRKTINNYEDMDEFFPTIKKAKQIIEADVEEGSLTGAYNATAAIFNLKNNFGWHDKQEIDQNIGNKDDKPFKVESSSEMKSIIDDVLQKMKDK